MSSSVLLDAGAESAPGTAAFKIVVAGPVGAGKTTFINTISEIETVATEAPISDGSGTATKTTTTVGIDFGRITLAGGLELYLFGTPGQERFTFMWDIVSTGMLGVIILLDCERPETYATARTQLEYFRARGDVPAIVAANKVDDFEVERERIIAALDLSESDFVVPTNALDRQAVKQTLIELLELVVATLI
jgi:small GTP-binding protein